MTSACFTPHSQSSCHIALPEWVKIFPPWGLYPCSLMLEFSASRSLHSWLLLVIQLQLKHHLRTDIDLQVAPSLLHHSLLQYSVFIYFTACITNLI